MPSQKSVVRGMYWEAGYMHKRRFMSFWHQIRLLMNLEPELVLEIGRGTGLTSTCLKSWGLKVFTLDIDFRLEPDAAGSCLFIPFKNNSFDAVACFQVLEHLPFEDFELCLAQLREVTRKWVVLSLPDASRVMSCSFKLPGAKTLEVLLPLPFPRSRHKFDGEHYWEINKRGYSLKNIRTRLEKYFILRQSFQVHENPYHRFFVLEKKEPAAETFLGSGKNHTAEIKNNLRR